MRILLALLLVFAGAPAFAEIGDIAGHYTGEVDSGGRIPTETTFVIKNGQATGHYVMHEADRDVRGTLEFERSLSPTDHRFTWTDTYGTGYVEFRFLPDYSGFKGVWGDTVGPAGKWSGERLVE
jgi:hypothetical protein